MKALFALVSANFRKSLYAAAFLPMIFWIYPAAIRPVHASGGQNTALVFEVKPNQNQNFSVTYEQLVQNDPLVSLVVEYIENKAPQSPLANPETVARLIQYTNLTHDRQVWMRALAISFVESHMCTYTPKARIQGKIIESYNCSGITAGKAYRMYDNYESWFADMTNLLQKPAYINRPLKAYLKFYVNPGSQRWFNGTTRVEQDLMALEQQADEQRFALGNNLPMTASTAELALAK